MPDGVGAEGVEDVDHHHPRRICNGRESGRLPWMNASQPQAPPSPGGAFALRHETDAHQTRSIAKRGEQGDRFAGGLSGWLYLDDGFEGSFSPLEDQGKTLLGRSVRRWHELPHNKCPGLHPPHEVDQGPWLLDDVVAFEIDTPRPGRLRQRRSGYLQPRPAGKLEVDQVAARRQIRRQQNLDARL